MSEINDLGLECYNLHRHGDKDKRNLLLVKLQVLIRNRLGDKYIAYSINNTDIRDEDNEKWTYPSIIFRVKKSKEEDIEKVGRVMRNLFEISSIPPITFWSSEKFDVVLDISEYWKNLVVNESPEIKGELVDLFVKLEYDERKKLVKNWSDLIFLFDSYDMLVENLETDSEEQSLAKREMLSYSKKKREMFLSECEFLKDFEDLSKENLDVLKESVLTKMNEYINWHFVNVIN